MLYRETGQFRTSYAADHAILPIRQDRIGLAAILALATCGCKDTYRAISATPSPA